MAEISSAIFHSARTTIDGGWRISFDLTEQESEFVARLLKKKGKVFFLVIQDRLTESSDLDIPSLEE